MPRKILHLDLDAFFCSVEENNDPTLRGKPFAVGGRPDQRGVVASCSYAARSYGVHSAMPMAQAKRVCPGLIIVSGRHGDYGKISDQVMDYLGTLTPLIEQVSIDEAFLDLSDLPQPGEELAKMIQQYIQDQYKLPCSIGVASNKLVAKVATDFGKGLKRSNSPPRAITVVAPGTEAEFLAPLPTKALWGIGPKTSARLAELGIHTIGDIARLPVLERRRYLGNFGDDLARRALGIDDSPVHTSHELKSVSNETTFAHDIADSKELYETLHWLSESVGRRLRKHKLAGSTVKIKLRWANFTTLTRQMTISHPTSDDREIYAASKELFNKSWQKGKPVRLLGVGVTQFSKGPSQLSLWEAPNKKDQQLFSAVDVLRERYGKSTIMRGTDLQKKKASKSGE
ncbi:MAG: DNA polymerase IV [Acidobacteriaceae bacterium]